MTEPMTATEYRTAIKALGMSQRRAAKWLGVSNRTSEGWALAEHRIPATAAAVIRAELKKRARRAPPTIQTDQDRSR